MKKIDSTDNKVRELEVLEAEMRKRGQARLKVGIIGTSYSIKVHMDVFRTCNEWHNKWEPGGDA